MNFGELLKMGAEAVERDERAIFGDTEWDDPNALVRRWQDLTLSARRAKADLEQLETVLENIGTFNTNILCFMDILAGKQADIIHEMEEEAENIRDALEERGVRV